MWPDVEASLAEWYTQQRQLHNGFCKFADGQKVFYHDPGQAWLQAMNCRCLVKAPTSDHCFDGIALTNLHRAAWQAKDRQNRQPAKSLCWHSSAAAVLISPNLWCSVAYGVSMAKRATCTPSQLTNSTMLAIQIHGKCSLSQDLPKVMLLA